MRRLEADPPCGFCMCAGCAGKAARKVTLGGGLGVTGGGKGIREDLMHWAHSWES